MKKEYDTSVKEAIERVMSVFSEYIKTTPYFDIVWSGNVVHSPSAVVRGDYESDLANCLNPSNSTDLDPTSQ